MATQEVQPQTIQEPERVTIKVLSQDGKIVHFRIKRTTPLQKLMAAYAEQSNLALSALRFVFDGTPIAETDTPNTLQLEEGAVIEAFIQQTGGLRTQIWRIFEYKS